MPSQLQQVQAALNRVCSQDLANCHRHSLSGGSGVLVSLRKKFASSGAIIVWKGRGPPLNLKKPFKSPVARASANPSEPSPRSKTRWMNLRMLPKSWGYVIDVLPGRESRDNDQG